MLWILGFGVVRSHLEDVFRAEYAMVRFSFCQVHSASCVDKGWEDSKGDDGQTNWELLRISEV